MLITGLCMIASGCITDATTELTKAPFDATSQLTNGNIPSPFHNIHIYPIVQFVAFWN
jgi:hypothetical protein